MGTIRVLILASVIIAYGTETHGKVGIGSKDPTKTVALPHAVSKQLSTDDDLMDLG